MIRTIYTFQRICEVRCFFRNLRVFRGARRFVLVKRDVSQSTYIVRFVHVISGRDRAGARIITVSIEGCWRDAQDRVTTRGD
jgi:hypothetical protein